MQKYLHSRHFGGQRELTSCVAGARACSSRVIRRATRSFFDPSEQTAQRMVCLTVREELCDARFVARCTGCCGVSYGLTVLKREPPAHISSNRDL
jgi:hypothetical protein